MPARTERWEPPREREERRRLLERVEAHLESLDSLGFEVGEGMEVIHFLAELRDMAIVEALLHGADFNRQEREWVLNRVEERMGEMSRPNPWLRLKRKLFRW